MSEANLRAEFLNRRKKWELADTSEEQQKIEAIQVKLYTNTPKLSMKSMEESIEKSPHKLYPYTLPSKTHFRCFIDQDFAMERICNKMRSIRKANDEGITVSPDKFKIKLVNPQLRLKVRGMKQENSIVIDFSFEEGNWMKFRDYFDEIRGKFCQEQESYY